MPELPEVETVVSDLNKKIIGRKIIAVWFDAPKLIKKPKPAELEGAINGLKITGVGRRGKNILIRLTGNRLLLVHLKMSGHFLVGKWEMAAGKPRSLNGGALGEKVNGYIHFILYLDDGRQLALSDLRKFAKIAFGQKEEIENLPEIGRLGPDALAKELTPAKFREIVAREKRKIKQVLTDQEIIAGIGNIYADEILWASRVHPLRSAGGLSPAELNKIYAETRKILQKAVRLRGTSVSDFRDAAGLPGRYGNIRFVYRRTGLPCLRCQTPIKRLKLGGRSAHFCPACQRPAGAR